jgi:hypothetical protein
MNKKDIKKIAKKMNVETKGTHEEEIIIAIQIAEGNIPCYKTERRYECPEVNCLWEEECKSEQ